MIRRRPRSTLFPYTALFRSLRAAVPRHDGGGLGRRRRRGDARRVGAGGLPRGRARRRARGGVRSEEQTSELQARQSRVPSSAFKKKKTYGNKPHRWKTNDGW